AKAEAVSAYVSIPGAELVVPPQEFRRWLGESEISEFEPPEESLLDETDPDVADQFSGAAGETGPRELDGAQFQAIAGIVESVATGSMPPQTALELIRVGFPIIPEASARRIVEPLVGFVAATPAATPAQVA